MARIWREKLRKHEDPRLSFSTPEFREAQRIFTENFKKNFGRPVEWALVRKYPWSTPTLEKLDLCCNKLGGTITNDILKEWARRECTRGFKRKLHARNIGTDVAATRKRRPPHRR